MYTGTVRGVDRGGGGEGSEGLFLVDIDHYNELCRLIFLVIILSIHVSSCFSHKIGD